MMIFIWLSTGGLSEVDAFKLALSTWPDGVRPAVHWSESQADRIAHAHSDFVAGPMLLHGYGDKASLCYLHSVLYC